MQAVTALVGIQLVLVGVTVGVHTVALVLPPVGAAAPVRIRVPDPGGDPVVSGTPGALVVTVDGAGGVRVTNPGPDPVRVAVGPTRPVGSLVPPRVWGWDLRQLPPGADVPVAPRSLSAPATGAAGALGAGALLLGLVAFGRWLPGPVRVRHDHQPTPPGGLDRTTVTARLRSAPRLRRAPRLRLPARPGTPAQPVGWKVLSVAAPGTEGCWPADPRPPAPGEIPVLVSPLFNHTTWTPPAPGAPPPVVAARCSRRSPPPCPHLVGRCGVNATRDPVTAAGWYSACERPGGLPVPVLVRLWGTVVEHRRGWRASRGRLEAVVVPTPRRLAALARRASRRPWDPDRCVWGLVGEILRWADHWGVPVLTSPSRGVRAVWAMALDHHHGTGDPGAGDPADPRTAAPGVP